MSPPRLRLRLPLSKAGNIELLKKEALRYSEENYQRLSQVLSSKNKDRNITKKLCYFKVVIIWVMEAVTTQEFD